MRERSSILFLVKYPERGRVKTRLAATLGNDTALALYQGFVVDLLSVLNTCGRPRMIYYAPAEAQDRLRAWLGPEDSYTAQRGSDIGERMKNAFLDAFETGVEQAILIGSDVPAITADILDEGLRSLACNDVVIGPAMDGGYYLIGFNAGSFQPNAFDGIAWSTDTVFERTMAILSRSNHRVHVLPTLRDIDTPEDLEAYLKTRASRCSEQRPG